MSSSHGTMSSPRARPTPAFRLSPIDRKRSPTFTTRTPGPSQISFCPGQSLRTINSLFGDSPVAKGRDGLLEEVLVVRGTIIGWADAADQRQAHLWPKACACGPAGDASIRADAHCHRRRERSPLLRLVLRVLDALTPRLVFDALERLEIAERTERHGHAVVPDDVEVEVLGVLERIPAAHEMVLRELLVGVPTVDVGVARERLPRRAEALEQLRSLRVGRAVVHRDLARVQQGNPPVPAWPLAFVVGEVVRQDVLRQHFGEGACSPYRTAMSRIRCRTSSSLE